MKINPSPQRKLIQRTIAALLLGTAGAAGAMASLPDAHTQGAVSYVSGGIGVDEAAAMKRASAHYPLTVEFIRDNGHGHGEYLAGDKVVISGQHGQTMLDTVADGPFLLARLPAGKYTIVATNGGQSEQRSVSVKPQSSTRVVFEWGDRMQRTERRSG